MNEQLMQMVNFYWAILFIVGGLQLALIVLTIWLIVRFVRAHEKIADALTLIAGKKENPFS